MSKFDPPSEPPRVNSCSFCGSELIYNPLTLEWECLAEHYPDGKEEYEDDDDL